MCTYAHSLDYLCICRCFGLLVSPGRNVRDSDMHVIDMVIDCILCEATITCTHNCEVAFAFYHCYLWTTAALKAEDLRITDS